MKKVLKNKLVLASLALLMGFGLLSASQGVDNKYFEIAKNLEIFSNVYKEINTHYVDDVEPGKLMKEAIDGMLGSLDPFTNYISASKIESYRTQTTGKYGGIGSHVQKKDDYVIITEPYKDKPAYKAGLRGGDVILEVDGKSVKGKSVSETSEFLKGAPGTKVEVLIKRPGESQERTVKITREEISIPNVPYSGVIQEGIAYITLTTFTQEAGKNVADALKEIQKDESVKGVIFDLRGNGGGLLVEAINTTNVFVPKGEVITTTKSKIKEWDQSYKTLNTPVNTSIPLVVLVDRGSASASEIVSGSIQDLDRGVLVGRRTYGKGLVQNTKDVGYNSKVKMTISEYFIPSGRGIQGMNYVNGKAVDIPDSLANPFQTKNGRTVYDGGGINPDVEIEQKMYSNILRNLLVEGLIFDYVTEYVLTQEAPSSVEDINLTDAQFDAFVSFVNEKEFKFESPSEKKLDELRGQFEEDGYTEDLQVLVDNLEVAIEKEKKEHIYKYKSDITTYIERELATRYFFQQGKIKIGLLKDKEVKEAIRLLENPAEYNRILKGN